MNENLDSGSFVEYSAYEKLLNKVPYERLEQEIMDHLAAAWNLFTSLESTHPSHTKDFSDGVHRCQDIIIHRIVQRDYPNYFPTHRPKP